MTRYERTNRGRMRIKTLVFVLLCLSLASAAEWAGAGANWSHGTDMTFSVPEGLTAKEDDNGVMAVTHPSGAMYVSLIWAPSEKEAAQVIGAMVSQVKKDIPDVKLAAPKGGKVPNGTLEIQDGPGTINGKVFDVTVGNLNQNGKYLCFFALMTKDDMAKWNPLMESLIGSVKIN